MSESVATRNEFPGTYTHMARNSLSVAIVVMASSGCIVTGSPDFEDGTSTKPVLTVVAPAVTEILCVAPQDNVFPAQTFTVLVESQDLEDDPLEAALLIDYGTPKNTGFENPQPYANVASQGTIEIGSLNDEPRTVSRSWAPESTGVAAGECHSVTMMVVRSRFGSDPYFWCPTDDQFETVTWYVAFEDTNGNCGPALATCPIAGTRQFEYCPNPDELSSSNGGNP